MIQAGKYIGRYGGRPQNVGSLPARRTRHLRDLRNEHAGARLLRRGDDDGHRSARALLPSLRGRSSRSWPRALSGSVVVSLSVDTARALLKAQLAAPRAEGGERQAGRQRRGSAARQFVAVLFIARASGALLLSRDDAARAVLAVPPGRVAVLQRFATVPLLRGELVLHEGLLTETQLNDAIAGIQVSLGPLGMCLVMVSNFVMTPAGSLGAWPSPCPRSTQLRVARCCSAPVSDYRGAYGSILIASMRALRSDTGPADARRCALAALCGSGREPTRA